MTLENDLVAKIKRLHYSDKWPIGTIAAQLDIHHSAVRRVIALDILEKTLGPVHPDTLQAGRILEFLNRD